mgnify:FL=1
MMGFCRSFSFPLSPRGVTFSFNFANLYSSLQVGTGYNMQICREVIRLTLEIHMKVKYISVVLAFVALCSRFEIGKMGS